MISPVRHPVKLFFATRKWNIILYIDVYVTDIFGSSQPLSRIHPSPSFFSKGCRGLRHRVCSIDSYMMTSSNGNIFRVTGHLCGEFTGQRWIPAQRPVTPSFDVFFDLRLNKHLNEQSWGWWFETLSRPLWRHCNDIWIQGAACRPVLGLAGTVGWVCL